VPGDRLGKIVDRPDVEGVSGPAAGPRDEHHAGRRGNETLEDPRQLDAVDTRQPDLD